MTEESEFKMKSIIEEKSESEENNMVEEEEENVSKQKSTRKRKSMKPKKQSFAKVKENISEHTEEAIVKEKGKEK